MKKSILILGASVITLSLMAFGYFNLNNQNSENLEASLIKDVADNTNAKQKMEKRIVSDFIFDIGPRFSPITKEELNKAKSANDFLDEEQKQRIVSFNLVSIIIIENDKESNTRETGNSGVLTPKQIELLHSSEYSTNLKIRAEYQEKNNQTGKMEDSYSTPHLTIVPEKQAEFVYGKKALIEYLKKSIKEYTLNIEADKLQPAKLFFTVTKTGTIENVFLDRTSNFTKIDDKMIELISNLQGTWQSAENFNGEKVDQELVVSFGLMGC